MKCRVKFNECECVTECVIQLKKAYPLEKDNIMGPNAYRIVQIQNLALIESNPAHKCLQTVKHIIDLIGWVSSTAKPINPNM